MTLTEFLGDLWAIAIIIGFGAFAVLAIREGDRLEAEQTERDAPRAVEEIRPFRIVDRPPYNWQTEETDALS